MALLAESASADNHGLHAGAGSGVGQLAEAKAGIKLLPSL